MTRRPVVVTALGVVLPTAEQTWLLRACLWEGGDAREAWRVWRELAGDAKAAMVEDRWSVKRLLPLLYVALRDAGAEVDRELLPYLRLAYVREQMRSRTYYRVCREVLGALDRAGVPAVLLRGAALAATAYPEAPLRHCHDIALLVRGADIERAADAIAATGRTRQPPPFEPGAPAALLRDETTLPIELHVRPFVLPRYELAWDDLVARAGRRTVAGAGATILSPEDALLHVCGHASYSPGRESLRWACDAWFLLRANPGLDWDALLGRGRRARLVLPLAVTLGYLARELRAPVPAGVVERLHAEAAAEPGLARDIALRGARSGASTSLAAFVRRVPGGPLTQARVALWWLIPSREYVRDVMGVEGALPQLLRYVRRPFAFAREWSVRRSALGVRR